jgi:hypothetical protein
VQESIEQTEDTIEANIRELEQKIHAEQLRQNEVRVLLQQISKLQNDLKGFTKESGMCTCKSCICSANHTVHCFTSEDDKYSLIPI